MKFEDWFSGPTGRERFSDAPDIDARVRDTYPWDHDDVRVVWKTATRIAEDIGIIDTIPDEQRHAFLVSVGAAVRRRNGNRQRWSNGRSLLALPELTFEARRALDKETADPYEQTGVKRAVYASRAMRFGKGGRG